jgi:hypothetical protein
MSQRRHPHAVSHSDWHHQDHESVIPRIEAWVMIILILLLTVSGILMIDVQ